MTGREVGQVEEWQGVRVSRRIWIYSFRKNGFLSPGDVRPDCIWGMGFYVQPELLMPGDGGSKRLPLGINPCLELLSETQLLMVIAPPLRFCVVFLGIGLILAIKINVESTGF